MYQAADDLFFQFYT